jgi:sodium-independent sulfate anion transporter 11
LLIEHLSIAKSFGRLNNYTINPSSEFLAIGVTNLIGPLLGGYAASGSFSRTAINAKAGSRTPLAGIFTAALVVFAIYLLTPMLFFVPNAALSGVIIHAILDCKTKDTSTSVQ